MDRRKANRREEEADRDSLPHEAPLPSATDVLQQEVQAVLAEKHAVEPSPTTAFARQRTRTVMTVEENMRAGVDAYLEGVGVQQQMEVVAGLASSPSAAVRKPQSIVRPMPQQQGQTVAGGERGCNCGG